MLLKGPPKVNCLSHEATRQKCNLENWRGASGTRCVQHLRTFGYLAYHDSASNSSCAHNSFISFNTSTDPHVAPELRACLHTTAAPHHKAEGEAEHHTHCSPANLDDEGLTLEGRKKRKAKINDACHTVSRALSK